MCPRAAAPSEFSRWMLAHGDSNRNRNKPICNECMQQDELQKQTMMTRNKANVQASQDGLSAPHVDTNPHVTIFCSECNTAQSIDMNLFWKRGSNSHRFVRCSCTTDVCSQKKVSLGNWLRFQSDPASKISKWMKATGVYDNRTMPVHLTVKEYMERDELNREKTQKINREKVQIEAESNRKYKRMDM